MMSLITLSVSVLLSGLIGTQQMLKTLTDGMVNRDHLLPVLRGTAAMIVAIWLFGLLIWKVFQVVIGRGAKKNKLIAKIKGNNKLDGFLMTWVFLCVGMFLFISERVPFFTLPYPLLVYSGVILLIVLINVVLCLLAYGSLEFYKKWIKKIKLRLIIGGLGSLVLFSWLILLLPVIVKRMGLRLRQTKKKNVVLITSDTLRGDRFTPEYMPQTYKWFEKGTIFAQGYSPAPWTIPSFASMMTGKYSSRLGTDRFREHMPENFEKLHEKFLLLPKLETMAERFQDEGYSTMAVVTNGLLVEKRGFDQGFDSFENIEGVLAYDWGPAIKQTGWYVTLERLGLEQAMRRYYEYFVGATDEREGFKVDAEMVSDQAIRRLKEMKEPFFAWIHYVDAHPLFEPPEEFAPDMSNLSEGQRERIVSGNLIKGELDLRETVVDLYDGEVRYHDREIARVLRFLDRRGLSERTAVVFTADHGEQFWEAGKQGHGYTLRNEEIRVPLAVYPFKFDERIAEEEEISLRLLGEWLLAMGTGEPNNWLREEIKRPVFAEGMSTGDEKKGIIEDGRKFIWEIKSGLTKAVDAKNDKEINRYSPIIDQMESELKSWQAGNDKEGKEYWKLLEELDVDLERVIGY